MNQLGPSADLIPAHKKHLNRTLENSIAHHLFTGETLQCKTLPNVDILFALSNLSILFRCSYKLYLTVAAQCNFLFTVLERQGRIKSKLVEEIDSRWELNDLLIMTSGV